MLVFVIKAYGKYCGGMAVVAAANERNARTLASKIKPDQWDVRYGEPEIVERLRGCFCDCIDERVLAHFELGE